MLTLRLFRCFAQLAVRQQEEEDDDEAQLRRLQAEMAM
jgi:hypothetical protein